MKAEKRSNSAQWPVIAFAAALALSAIMLASVAHADDGRSKRDREDRGIHSVLNVKALGLHLSGSANARMRAEAKHDLTASTTKLVGEVSSVSVTGSTLVVTGKFGTTTVAVTNDTKLRGTHGDTIALSEITAGAHVKAKGTTNASTNVFTATDLRVTPAVKTFDREDALSVIARLEHFIAQLKLRFNL